MAQRGPARANEAQDGPASRNHPRKQVQAVDRPRTGPPVIGALADQSAQAPVNVGPLLNSQCGAPDDTTL